MSKIFSSDSADAAGSVAMFHNTLDIWPMYIGIDTIRNRVAPQGPGTYKHEPVIFSHVLSLSPPQVKAVGYSYKLKGSNKVIEFIDPLQVPLELVPMINTGPNLRFNNAEKVLFSNFVLSKKILKHILGNVPADQNCIVFVPELPNPPPPAPIPPPNCSMFIWAMHWGNIQLLLDGTIKTFAIGGRIGMESNPIPPYPADMYDGLW